MADIRYKWNDGLNSVQVSGDVSLPQFKVLGHRQKTIEASLSTGKRSSITALQWLTMNTHQATTPGWRVRFNLWGQWDTTSSRSTFLPRWSSSSPGSPSGSTEAPPRPEWDWAWPLSWPWPPSSPPPTPRFPKYPTLSLLTCIWRPVSSWCSPPC